MKNSLLRITESFYKHVFQRTITTTSVAYKHQDMRSQSKFSKTKRPTTEDLDTEEEHEEVIDEEYENLVKRSFRVPDMGHQVYVIQPYIKWGAKKKRVTTPQLQLEEAVALIKTLSSWKVVDKTTLSLQSFEKKTVFGKGNIEKIRNTVLENSMITAVFISIDTLKTYQKQELEEFFKVPVYDRYTIVIQIFREHAVTKEAKLQVEMAQIPYMYSRLREITYGSKNSEGAIGGAGTILHDTRHQLLKNKEAKIKQALASLKEQRKLLRNKRQKNEFPVVAVVGYTNCGKTSLIKALTGEEKMEGQNKLFATLDITCHAGLLPSKLKVLYIDTIGFISDIPTSLIESFVATLEDALFADVILHVRDISHPDAKAQDLEVANTLKNLNLPDSVMSNIVVAANKIDLVSDPDLEVIQRDNLDKNMVYVSAETQHGLLELETRLEKAVLKASDRSVIIIRVPSGGEECSWLYKQAAVSKVHADEQDNQFLYMKVIITKSKLAKFKHMFIKNFKSI